MSADSICTAPQSERLGRFCSDLGVGAGLLLALGLVYGLDASGAVFLPQGPFSSSLWEREDSVVPASNATISVPSVSTEISPSTPDKLEKTDPAHQGSNVTESELALKSKSSQPTAKAVDRPLLFAGTQPAVSVVRAERPAVQAVQAVEFFSIKSEAQTVAFVVDCSGSMNGHRFERARLELMRSVCRLKANQGVFIIFFNDGPVPLPGEDVNKPALVLPSGWVKYEIGKRLERMQAGGGTNPENSLRIAASLNPDVIFLLSDGEFSQINDSHLDNFRKRSVKVNTIAFESPEGSRQLEQIAQKTGGTFRFVPHETLPVQDQLLLAELAEQLIMDLEAPSIPDRERARRALVDLAHGRDFGSTSTPWWRWYRDLLTEGYRNLPQQQIVEIIRTNKNAHARFAAILSAGNRNLNIPEVLVTVLTDPDRTIAQAARQGLVKTSDGYDFGPAEKASDAEHTQAASLWLRWLSCRVLIHDLSQESPATIILALRADDVVRRWAAVTVAHQKRLQVPTELLGTLQDTDENIRTEASRALIALIPRGELGPTVGDKPGRYIPDGLIELLSHGDSRVQLAADKSLAELARSYGRSWKQLDKPLSAESATRWKAWWQERKNVLANRRFLLAKQLYNEGKKEPAGRRFREIILQYPGTSSAGEAARLLNTLD